MRYPPSAVEDGFRHEYRVGLQQRGQDGHEDPFPWDSSCIALEHQVDEVGKGTLRDGILHSESLHATTNRTGLDMPDPNDDDDLKIAAAVPDRLRPRVEGHRQSPDAAVQDDGAE